jgi:predicted dienelactone hydrolase
MPGRPLFALILLACALAAPLAAAAAPFTAGERRLATTAPTAAVRNHGDPTLRLIVWYPATAAEQEVDVGPPNGPPLFIAGAVARDAPFADAARHPLVLLSHGFGGSARQMTWLGAALARRGYVVVAVDHPGTNGVDGVTAEGAYAPWERATDLRAALDFVLACPDLASHVDAARIGVAGFSLGGFTALLEAGARADFARFLAFCDGPRRDAICDPQLEYPLDFHDQAAVLARPAMAPLAADQDADLRDPRIRAAFLIAPALVEALDRDSLRRIALPVSLVLGDGDPIAPPATNGELAARLIPGARLRVLPRVGHYDFLSECGPAAFKAIASFCADGPGTHRAQTHATTVAAAIAFFDRALAAD